MVSGGGTAATDAQGHYIVAGPSSGRVAMYVWSPSGALIDYTAQARYDLPAGSQTVNFIVHPLVTLPRGDSTISGVIHGDEIAADDEFGGSCSATSCIVVTLDCCLTGAKDVELTLSWNDPSRRLVLYVPHYDYFPFPVPPAARVCCGSPLTTTYSFNFDYDRVAVGFESVGGGVPAADDSQTFQLTAKRIVK